MRAQVTDWTPAMDRTLRALRADGLVWDAIAARMGLSRWTVIERGRRIGAPRVAPAAEDVAELPADPRRAPLPAGHPVTWALLTDGTLLDGVPYPHPVFER